MTKIFKLLRSNKGWAKTSLGGQVLALQHTDFKIVNVFSVSCSSDTKTKWTFQVKLRSAQNALVYKMNLGYKDDQSQ